MVFVERSELEKNLGYDIIKISREIFGELGDYALCRHNMAYYLHYRNFTWESVAFFVRGVEFPSFKEKLKKYPEEAKRFVREFITIRDQRELDYQRKLYQVKNTTHYFILRKAMNERYGEVPWWV